MSNAAQPTGQQLDEQLAAFTDQVMDGQEQDSMNADDEMAGLAETVLQLRAAARNARPDAVVAARIRKNVMAQWAKPAAAARWRWTPQLRLAIAAAGLLLVIAIGLLLSPSGGQLTGSAEGSLLLPAVLAAAGIVTIIVILRKTDS